ncbi:MAG: dihydroneopterin aldolase [Pedobacter sp.]|nr:dihydroneopterin aldolase [Pedobacter sp.]MDQ8051641.1 dihydroneopterin aldolase [Pedobacter sp.]
MFVQTIALREVKFYAFHGFYPQEQLTGNHFLVDVEVDFVPFGESENLKQTVNYEVMNTIVAKHMNQVQKLLETVVKNIIEELIQTYPYIRTATVGIKKLHPPMPGEIGHSFVQLSYTFPNQDGI